MPESSVHGWQARITVISAGMPKSSVHGWQDRITVISAGMPESSVHGWQALNYDKPYINQILAFSHQISP